MNFLNRFKYARHSYMMTALVVGIVLMINFISAGHFLRVDLTHNQFYALSDGSKSIMRELDDIVNVKVYFSEQLPPNLFVVRQYVDDILDELSSYSRGNLSVEFLNPSDPEIATEATEYGIPQIRINVVEQDKIEVKNGFLGIAILYGDRVEVLPVVQNIFNVEYDLVASIKKVTATEDKVLGYVVGHDEPSISEAIEVGQIGDAYSVIKKALDRNYVVKEVELDDSSMLEGVDTLLLAGAKKSFTNEEKYGLDQFMMSGGNVVMLLDQVEVSAGLSASSLSLELDDLLNHYGVRVERQLVLDRSNERASFNQGFVNFVVPYPYWIKAINANFDSLNPIVNQIDSFVLPWVSPVSSLDKEGIESTVLAQTTENAWVVSHPFNLDPSTVQTSNERQQHSLAVLLKGAFESYYGESELADANENHLERAESDVHLLVVGNSRMISDRFLQQFPQNLPFFMNMVDFLTLDESLISIRSKSSFDLPLKDLNVRDRQIVKFLGTFLMPILVIAFGITRYYLRKKKVYIL